MWNEVPMREAAVVDGETSWGWLAGWLPFRAQLLSNGLAGTVSDSQSFQKTLSHTCTTALAERDTSCLQLCCPTSNQSASSHPA